MFIFHYLAYLDYNLAYFQLKNALKNSKLIKPAF